MYVHINVCLPFIVVLRLLLGLLGLVLAPLRRDSDCRLEGCHCRCRQSLSCRLRAVPVRSWQVLMLLTSRTLGAASEPHSAAPQLDHVVLRSVFLRSHPFCVFFPLILAELSTCTRISAFQLEAGICNASISRSISSASATIPSLLLFPTLASVLQAPHAASPPPLRAFLGPRECELDYPRKLACPQLSATPAQAKRPHLCKRGKHHTHTHALMSLSL